MIFPSLVVAMKEFNFDKDLIDNIQSLKDSEIVFMKTPSFVKKFTSLLLDPIRK